MAVVNEAGLSFVKNSFEPKVLDLPDAIKDAKDFFASLMVSYMSNGFRPFILLSGGLDSRCTASVLAGSLSPGLVSGIGSYTMKMGAFSAEREIAEGLATKFNFRRLESVPLQRKPAWQDWRRSFLGAYSMFEPFPRFSKPHVLLGGGSAENVKPFYDWDGSTENIRFPETVPSDMAQQILDDIKSGIADFQGVATPILSPEKKHYQAFRNRFHFGKDVRDSVFNYAPLAVAMMIDSHQNSDLSSFHRLIYESGSESIFNHPFDEEGKKFGKPIPNAWLAGSKTCAELHPRELFYGDHAASSYANLSGTEENFCEPRSPSIPFLTDDLFSEAERALSFVKEEGLLDERLQRSAITQLSWLKNEPQRRFPGHFPDLLAVLSLGLIVS